MEIGSQICTPRNPDCLKCPLNRLCPTFADGLQATIPMAAPKKVITELTHVAFVIRDRGQLLMLKNTADQWWTGLWDFPRVDITYAAKFRNKSLSVNSPSSDDLDWLASELHKQNGIDCTVDQHGCTFKHPVTRYRITLHTFTASVLSRPSRNPNLAWHRPPSALKLPLTAPAKKILKGLPV
jgi:A/G-specific adenine glycosylase